MWASMESFPFLGRRGKALTDGQESGGAPGSPRTGASKIRNPPPVVKVGLERKVYRPGDTVVATIEIGNEGGGGKVGMVRDATGDAVLMEDLSVEVRGIEKLDPQWLVTPKPPTAKQRRGPVSLSCQSRSVSSVENVCSFLQMLGISFCHSRSAWDLGVNAMPAVQGWQPF